MLGCIIIKFQPTYNASRRSIIKTLHVKRCKLCMMFFVYTPKSITFVVS